MTLVVGVLFNHPLRADAAPRFIRRIEWVNQGVWLKADTHTHTTFSDGSYSVAQVVDKAVQFGCDVIAITDHATRSFDLDLKQYINAIDAARKLHPDRVILAGLEWNIPPWGGREHATVLIRREPAEHAVLGTLRENWDDRGRDEHHPEMADAALRWLELSKKRVITHPVVILNHPSRSDPPPGRIEAAFRRWRSVNDLAIGFSGAPGHQATTPIGHYRTHDRLIDRWDPVAAKVGGVWDTLLSSGINLWAARAPSDFHNHPDNDDIHGGGDYWPGEFSETWLYAPARSARGVLRAFRAGSFFAAHGHITRRVVLTVSAHGLDRPAWPGEVVELSSGSTITVRMEMDIPQTDWVGQPNHLDQLELIQVTAQGGVVIANRPPSLTGHALTETLTVPPGGIVVRARGRRVIDNGPDLMFYTNPVRIVTPTTP
jgi:hypothetical protein